MSPRGKHGFDIEAGETAEMGNSDSLNGGTARTIIPGNDNGSDQEIDFTNDRKKLLRMIVDYRAGTPEEIALAEKQLLETERKEEGLIERARNALKKIFGAF